MPKNSVQANKTGYDWEVYTMATLFKEVAWVPGFVYSSWLLWTNHSDQCSLFNGKIFHVPFLRGKFLKAIWAKRGIFRPKFSEQNIIIISLWKGERSQTLLVKWECHCLPFVEEKIQALPSPSLTLQWTLENSYLWGLLLRLNGNQRVLLTSWIIVPRSVPYLNSG